MKMCSHAHLHSEAVIPPCVKTCPNHGCKYLDNLCNHLFVSGCIALLGGIPIKKSLGNLYLLPLDIADRIFLGQLDS